MDSRTPFIPPKLPPRIDFESRELFRIPLVLSLVQDGIAEQNTTKLRASKEGREITIALTESQVRVELGKKKIGRHRCAWPS